MPEILEKRGPIEKGPKGWPINPFGVAALILIGLIIVFLILAPLISQKAVVPSQQANSKGGQIAKPTAGEIIKGDQLTIDLAVDEPSKVAKIQFWAKTYADGKWGIIGEVSSQPFKLDWQIPDSYQNKAIAITSHIFTKDGKVIKDPGGWREGIIILNN